ncbi:RrF2 family transcriptional regulator [Cesiribacter andamanensis]|uniref:Cysteine metabolism repressor n=1 Tax=Cesiribacter andamanensis AMV16 TaxID=1279009 RepID=M7NQ97_9BACT|nr:Rrf2 family transcriptional regulator [Cesiribacter andamanensis]EMR03895.1 Cysteine metabolism repressor [Cesiribacter andamanensis AMV16]
MISKKTKYAINALVYLARRWEQGPVLISEIARAESIPQKFLEAILLELKRAQILASKKGKGGGYFLIRAPQEVSMAEVMRLFDGPIALLPCTAHRYYERCEECRNEHLCGIRDVFSVVRAATVRLLKNATLSEIMRREEALRNQPLPGEF